MRRAAERFTEEDEATARWHQHLTLTANLVARQMGHGDLFPNE